MTADEPTGAGARVRVPLLSDAARFRDRSARRLPGGPRSASAWRARSGSSGRRSAFFGAVTSAVNEAWGVEKQRSFWKHRLVSFLMLVAATGVMAVALLFVSSCRWRRRRGSGDAGQRFSGWAADVCVFRYLARAAHDRRGPRVLLHSERATRFRDVWVGAILTGVLWRSRFSGFSWYARQNER